MTYEAVIGLEIHVELNSPTKLFCDCANSPGDRPNINTCPTCLWMPGAVVQLSQNAVELAALTALALNCTIQPHSTFDQKVYYYPDVPKGYQLSQQHRPLAIGGRVDVSMQDGGTRRVPIHHMHMEEDVAKLVHETEGHIKISLVDFNRAGAPLVEIVTEPAIRSAHEAMEFLKTLRRQIRYAGTAECSMETGSMRCDANISIRPAGTEQLNTKVEVKNMNSVRAVGSAIDFEIQRQQAELEAGNPIELQTRLWDPEKNITTPMREKSSAPCIPDPSVPAIMVDEDWVEQMRQKLPEMPAQRQQRFVQDYALHEDEAMQMSAEREVAEFFETTANSSGLTRMAAQWISARLLPALKERNLTLADTKLSPKKMSELLQLVDSDKITAKAAREVLQIMLEQDKSAAEIVEQMGFAQVEDADELQSMVDSVLAEHPDAVENYRNGKKEAAGFLIGQVMRLSKGKANPKLLRQILDKKLQG